MFVWVLVVFLVGGLFSERPQLDLESSHLWSVNNTVLNSLFVMGGFAFSFFSFIILFLEECFSFFLFFFVFGFLFFVFVFPSLSCFFPLF